jgi:hypothetical protein
MKIATYTISAYEGDYYIFAIPLRTTKKWLQQALKRTEVMNGEELTENQFKKLKPKIIPGVECCWYPRIHYFLEGYNEAEKDPASSSSQRAKARS